MWFKVDDQLAFNAKVVAAGNEAMGLWVRAGSWSAAQLTNGFVPEHMAIAMANGMASAMANGMAKPCGADALVMAGLWDEVDGGYQFHDWAEFQPSAEAEKEKRKNRSLAGQKGAAARWHGKTDGKRHGNSHSKSHGKPMANECDRNAPSRPDPSSTPNGVESMRKPQRQAYPDDFEQFWAEYPVKRDKGKALKAWKSATKRADNGAIIAGAVRYREDPNREDGYTKYAEGWLNGDGWEDEPLPSRERPSERGQARTFDQMRHDQNLELWSRVKAEEEGADPWQRQLGA